jgi:hypothetical protein
MDTAGASTTVGICKVCGEQKEFISIHGLFEMTTASRRITSRRGYEGKVRSLYGKVY